MAGIRRTAAPLLALIAVGAFTALSPAAAEAQSSGRSVATVGARVIEAPQVRVNGSAPPVVVSVSDEYIELEMGVNVTAGSGYVVAVSPASFPREGDGTGEVWVRNASGSFERLTGEAPVPVVRSRSAANAETSSIRYRVARSGSEDAPVALSYTVWLESGVQPVLASR